MKANKKKATKRPAKKAGAKKSTKKASKKKAAAKKTPSKSAAKKSASKKASKKPQAKKAGSKATSKKATRKTGSQKGNKGVLKTIITKIFAGKKEKANKVSPPAPKTPLKTESKPEIRSTPPPIEPEMKKELAVDRDLEEFMRDDEELKTPKKPGKNDLDDMDDYKMEDDFKIEEDIPATDDAAEDDDDY